MNDFFMSHHMYKTWQQATFDPCDSNVYLSQALSQFNSTLSTIHHDVTTLQHYAAIGFDSLPKEIVPILEGVWRGKMPSEWYKGGHGELLSLKDGMTGNCIKCV